MTNTAANIPDKPTLDGIEERWAARWDADGTYRFDASAAREDVFSIDTPPPTVSGSLHMGHVFSYTHTDIDRPLPAHARQGRLLPDRVGRQRPAHRTPSPELLRRSLRSEPAVRRRVRATVPRRSAEEPPRRSRSRARTSSNSATSSSTIDEKVFEALLKRLGLSVDWDYRYATIDERSRPPCQRAFLRNVDRGEAYSQEAPTLWDVDFRTAVAQAEMEDRERPRCVPQDPVRSHRRRWRRSRSTPPAPSCSPPVSPWWPIPTTSATSRCSAPR